jgi:bifunctional enzyme CysN/CysC
VVYRIDVDTLHREEIDTLGLNDIGRIQIATASPLFYDSYKQNHATGSFILVDPYSNVTVAAGMIRGEVRSANDLVADLRESGGTSPNVQWDAWNISREEREKKNGHEAIVLWFTGLSGSGKSTIARAVERKLFDAGCRTMLLDGDQMRHGLNGDLSFSASDRTENIRRVGEVSRLFFEQGSIVLCTFVSPFRDDRERARGLIPEGKFIEIHVDCSLDEAKRRDPKGLYAKAEAGAVRHMTGISSAYEAPLNPELVLDTGSLSVEESISRVLETLRTTGVISSEGE